MRSFVFEISCFVMFWDKIFLSKTYVLLNPSEDSQ